MKIGILTYYEVHNHGAVLQANALKTVLNKMGHDVEFVRFARNYDYIPEGNEKKYKIGLSSIPFYVKYLVEYGAANIFYNVKKSRMLGKYRKENIKIGARYSDFEGDAVIIGSDEVFSLEIGINPFLFGYALNTPLVLSYAGSFGPTTMGFLKEHHMDQFVAAGLGQMKAVGVRDKNSYNIAKQLCPNQEVSLVCDPVILYGYKNEMTQFKPSIEDYLLIYSYDKNMNSKDEIVKIRKFAQGKGLKTISVGYHHSWCDQNINASPNELLGWIKNAKYVITDTFHGSVIAIICNTDIMVKVRKNQNKLMFLLEEYGLEDRVFTDFDELSFLSGNKINYANINNLVKLRRKKSLDLLMKTLSN